MTPARNVILLACCVVLCAAAARAETARDFFNRGAERFTKDDNEHALKWVNEGLAQYPEDPALLQLKHLLEQRQQQQSQNQKDQQQKQDQQLAQQQKQEEQQKAENQKQQGEQAQSSPAQQAEEKEGDEEKNKPAQEMTKDEAVLLLDAMKEQEQALREKIAQDRIRSSMGRLPPVEKDW